MQHKVLLLISLLFLLNISLAKEKKKDCVEVYKLDGGKCGELCLGPYVSKFAVWFKNCTLGACKDVGYTSFDHNMTVKIARFGKFNVTVFNKTSES